MRFLVAVLFLLSSEFSNATNPPFWILGKWKFVAYIYQGVLNPPLNPKLDLFYQFTNDGQDELFYSRTDESGFCNRKGEFSLSYENNQQILTDRVVWVNEKNNDACSRDTDMQLDNLAIVPIQFIKGQLLIEVGLAGESFIYVFSPSK